MIYRDFVRGVLYGVTAINVTNPFGKIDPFILDGKKITWHNGIDLTPIVKVMAYEKGKVYEVGYNSVRGNYVFLQHGDKTISKYEHLANGTVTAKLGDIVERGQIVGVAGGTGKVTGAHLHFEIRINNVPVDPLPYLQGKKAIKPYEDKIIMIRPELPMLKVNTTDMQFRDTPNGKVLGKLVNGQSYVYVGKSQIVNKYEWAEINVNGAWVFCALNPAWNTIVLPAIKPFSASIEKDGLICEVSLKAK